MSLYIDDINLNDLESVNELWRLAHELHVEHVPDIFEYKNEDKYTKESLSLALFCGTKIFGCFDKETGEMVGILETHTSMEDLSVLKLKCLYVKEEYRGNRVGKKLFNNLMEYFDKYSFFKHMEGKSYIEDSRSFWTNRGFSEVEKTNEFATLLRYTK